MCGMLIEGRERERGKAPFRCAGSSMPGSSVCEYILQSWNLRPISRAQACGRLLCCYHTCSAFCYSLVSCYSLLSLLPSRLSPLSLLAILLSIFSLFSADGVSAPLACYESVVFEVVQKHDVAVAHQIAGIECSN